ncbi:nuclear receptor-interacting protein 1 [Onychostoma macrolepis]|uniref:nuclear receptor-interacting protein 1 n=1 Tax=Onychostoma macrolepis TaxID=369639 RepID=UPI00272A57C5|nr:nuclear receptor-interacting protein 1 [Onychostoma macrolepis]XP_058644561.1 nuclear receptor-interacting protein 1 [Onychostoma macrolepis]XP_058644562.1 nuclear receptor-interacting protein 1 [Onychostoma macrolepis]
MTHGVESGPETHQDSAALTYLEGLLMHPVTTGPAATATQRSEPVQNNEENANRVTRVFQLPNHGSPSQDKGSPPSAASQHLKKARLLRSGAWSGDDSQKRTGTVAEVNGQRKEHYKGGLDGSEQGESTLLASLLQSFSSRLQSVALSQHISQSHKPLDRDSSESAPADKETCQSYGTASGRLKSLMRKSKQQNHNNVPYCRQSNQNRSPDSPHSSQSSAQPTSSESMSCTERLKAVANMVRTRSSPASSPKPSVACSQLALLLSSEAHLQQYSREQAIKAQLTSRSASERLAAMATQQTQDKRPPSMGQPTTAPDMLSSLNVQNGTLPPPEVNSSKKSPSLSSPSMRPPKERRPFDRQSRPPQNCSSLLLLLLNNHNSQQQLTRNGHLEDDYGILPSRASSLQSDSEYSSQDNSLTKDSSDAESFSSCSPIDLSMKSRVPSQKSEACSSLTPSVDKLTESLINKWKPEPSVPKVCEATDLDTSPDVKSHDEVTLMQLLLDRRNNEKVNKSSDNPSLRPDAIISSLTAGPLKQIGTPEDSRTWSPLDQQTATFSSISPSYSFPSPHAQSSPLDLCKSKAHSSEKTLEPPFSASKLLQNMAQSGKNNFSPSPPHKPTSRRQSPELELDKPQALLDQLVVPHKRNRASMIDGGSPPALPAHKCERSPSASSQIENLLEKRTVLQLLLGTASQKERTSGHRVFEMTSGGLEKPQRGSVNCDSSNGPSPHLKIKTEPVEENLSSDSSDDGLYHQRRSSQHSPIVDARDTIKSELCPTETAAKFGLLSQLLKQQNATYHSNPHTRLFRNSIKEEPVDFQSPVPKKRKLCIKLAEHLSNELCQPSRDTTSDNLVSGTPEVNGRGLAKPKEEELVGSPRSKTPLSRESQGFNVLKQLLLSENCLKELSQPRGTPSPFIPQANCAANGNLTQSSFPQELSNLPWYPYSLNTNPKTAPAPVDTTGGSLVWAKGSPKASPKPVKKEPEGSPAETFSREERSSADSPPLTRSNPILYYMLQRGNGQLRPEIRDQVQPAHCIVGANVESCIDYEHRINSPVHRHTHS